jgi:long-chain acyl-CoA synthetase
MIRLTQSLQRAQRLEPEKTAVIFGDRRWTWRQHADRVARLASVLHSLGMRGDDRVAMLSHSSDRYLEFFFATLWAGGTIVPVPTRYATAEIEFLLNDSGAEILLVGDDFLPIVGELVARAPAIRHLIYAGEAKAPEGMIDYEAALAAAAPVDDAGRGGADVAVLFYTGGTTGRAKGVMLTHENCYCNSCASIFHTGVTDRTVCLHAGPLYHAAAGSRVFTNTVLAATHVVIPRFTVPDVLQSIERDKVTMVSLVPTMMSMILNDHDIDRYDLSSLELIGYGGAPMPVATLEALMRRLPHVRFAQAYGMTELSPACTYLEPRYHSLDAANVHRLASGGRAAIGVDLRVVDADDRDVPRGEIGEIVVGGPIVMKGYWRQPELTAQALRGGYMHTGDLGYLDEDGFVYIVDRLKDMIVTGGENVYSVEVENAIQTHPAVKDCAVIGIPHEMWGEAVHAVVVLKANAAEICADDVVAHCRRTIAAFKCPRSVEFRLSMPLSAANKILKSELRKPFWANRARQVG